MSAYERVLDALASHNCTIRTRGQTASAQCPAHEDRDPSLSLRRIEGSVLVHCHAGCDTADVLASLSLAPADLYDDPRGAAYVYDNGRTVVRTPDKRFRQNGTEHPPELYRLAKVREAVASGQTVYVVEGEKDVLALESLGAVATCSPMGAGKWSKVDPSPLYGATVVVVADQDDPGRRHAEDVLRSLHGHAAVTIAAPAEGKDAADHIAAGHTLDDLRPVEVDPAGMAFRRDVAAELQRLRVRRAAQDALRAENEPEAQPFDSGTLREVMARPADPPMRVERLIPSDASALLAAQRKTGKTTLSLNLSRCLLTGEDFLGAFGVRPLAGSVGFLNYEVGAAQLARWAHDCGVPQDRLLLVNLRGRRNPLAHPDDRARLAALLRSHDVEAVIIDPFGRAYSGASQNDAGEVGAWLVDLDRFVRAEAGATDLVLNAHAGWNGERTRGSSALEDWADVVVTLTRDPDDESQRFLRAVGRDVDLDEDRLDYDPQTRMLRLTGTGSRRAARDSRKLSEIAVLVVRAARETPGLSVAAAERPIKAMDDNPGFRSGDVSKAAKFAAEQGLMRIEPSIKGSATRLYAKDSDTSPDLSRTSPGENPPTSPTSPYRGEVEVGGSGEPSPVDGIGERLPLNGSNGAVADPAAHNIVRRVVAGKSVLVDLDTGKVLDQETP